MPIAPWRFPCLRGLEPRCRSTITRAAGPAYTTPGAPGGIGFPAAAVGHREANASVGHRKRRFGRLMFGLPAKRQSPRGVTMVRSLEQMTMRKVYLRILPFAALTYFFCYLDRINVGFAALTMNKDIGLDAAIYGMAAGAFFWGYVLFEVPSNLILEKVGARIWIARIMITWGILAGLTAMVTGSTSFGIVRFLLGVAEAGFFPGIILYFTYWFPSYHHARIVSGFLVGLPVAVAIGAPISTALLGLDGLLGLRGWQIMYIAEGLPTVLIGVLTLFVLTDKPE